MVKTRTARKGCHCERCLHVFRIAMVAFAMAVPAFILFHQLVSVELVMVLGAAAGLGLLVSALSLLASCALLLSGHTCRTLDAVGDEAEETRGR